MRFVVWKRLGWVWVWFWWSFGRRIFYENFGFGMVGEGFSFLRERLGGCGSIIY